MCDQRVWDSEKKESVGCGTTAGFCERCGLYEGESKASARIAELEEELRKSNAAFDSLATEMTALGALVVGAVPGAKTMTEGIETLIRERSATSPQPPMSLVTQTMFGKPTAAVGMAPSSEVVDEIEHMKCVLTLRDGREVALADADVLGLSYEWRAKTGIGYKLGDMRPAMHEHTGEFKLFLSWTDKKIAAKYQNALVGLSDLSEHW